MSSKVEFSLTEHQATKLLLLLITYSKEEAVVSKEDAQLSKHWKDWRDPQYLDFFQISNLSTTSISKSNFSSSVVLTNLEEWKIKSPNNLPFISSISESVNLTWLTLLFSTKFTTWLSSSHSDLVNFFLNSKKSLTSLSISLIFFFSIISPFYLNNSIKFNKILKSFITIIIFKTFVSFFISSFIFLIEWV